MLTMAIIKPKATYNLVKYLILKIDMRWTKLA